MLFVSGRVHETDSRRASSEFGMTCNPTGTSGKSATPPAIRRSAERGPLPKALTARTRKTYERLKKALMHKVRSRHDVPKINHLEKEGRLSCDLELIANDIIATRVRCWVLNSDLDRCLVDISEDWSHHSTWDIRRCSQNYCRAV